MIRISDIIKMGDSGDEPMKNSVSIEASRKENIGKVVKDSEEDKMKTNELYARGLSLIEDAMLKLRSDNLLDPKPISEFAKELVDAMVVEGLEQFDHFYKSAHPAHYLYNHSVNVGLLVVKIGIWDSLNKSDLVELAFAGLLHDIGMVKVEAVACKEGALREADRVQIAEHPLYSAAILARLNCMSKEAIAGIRTHHDRGTRARFSQVLSLADIYEAMTHSRVYRKAKLPHQAIEEIVTIESSHFQPSVIKMFVNNIGIYPIGSWVRLNTEEAGVVIGSNKNYPLRPKINVILSSSGERLEGARIIDLCSEPHLYIDGPMDRYSS